MENTDYLKSIDETLKKILSILEGQVEPNQIEPKRNGGRSIENSPNFQEYKDFFECFEIGFPSKTSDELFNDYENEFGTPPFKAQTAGKIFSHFIDENLVKYKKTNNSTKKSYPLKLKSF